MTTTAAPAARAAAADRDVPLGPGWVLSDVAAMTGRNLRHWLRQPQLIVFSTIQPVMFVLLFNYVFGGAIALAGDIPGGYTTFLLPGIFVQASAFGATQAAVGLAEDLKGGAIDRFRSLPMTPVAVLAGRTAADAVRSLFVVLLMTGVGHLVGFRFQGSFLESVTALLVVAAFAYALAWVFATIGLTVKGGAEAAQAAGFVTIFPLVFASSAFVQVASMPGWLQVFAQRQPFTAVIDACRGLVLGQGFTGEVAVGLAWIAGILVVFVPLAVTRYRRVSA